MNGADKKERVDSRLETETIRRFCQRLMIYELAGLYNNSR